MRPNINSNSERFLKKIGGFSYFSPNWKIVKFLMEESLEEKEILLALSYWNICLSIKISSKFKYTFGNLWRAKVFTTHIIKLKNLKRKYRKI